MWETMLKILVVLGWIFLASGLFIVYVFAILWALVIIEIEKANDVVRQMNEDKHCD